MVIQGNKSKSGKISNTSVVAPVPINTPSTGRTNKPKDMQTNPTSSESQPAWNQNEKDESNNNPDSNQPKSAAWTSKSATEHPPKFVRPDVIRNWADADESDDDEDFVPNTDSRNQVSDSITIQRDEFIDTSNNNNYNNRPRPQQQQQQSGDWRSQQNGGTYSNDRSSQPSQQNDRSYPNERQSYNNRRDDGPAVSLKNNTKF